MVSWGDRLARWGIPVLAVAASALLRWTFDSLLVERLPYSFFIPAVMLAAWRGGVGPATLATALGGVIGFYAFVEPHGQVAVFGLNERVVLIAYTTICGCGIFAIEAVRRAQLRAISYATQLQDHQLQLKKEIRERTESQQRLQGEQQQLLITLESIADAVIVVDSAGLVRSMNSSAQNLTGLSTADVARSPIDRVLALHRNDGGECIKDAVERTMSTGEVAPIASDWTLTTVAGTPSFVEGSISPLADDRGTFGAVLVLRDVSHRRAHEETDARLAALVASSEDAILSVSSDGTIQSWNAGAEALFGYAADEVIGRPIAIVRPMSKTTELPDLWERFDAGDRLPPYETVRRRKDGREVDVSLRASPLFDDDGQARGAVIVARDVTLVKRADRRRAARLEVTECLSHSDDWQSAAPAILRAVCTQLRWQVGLVWIMDETRRGLEFQCGWIAPSSRGATFVDHSQRESFKKGEGLPGRVWEHGEPAWISDVSVDDNFPRASVATEAGLHAALGVPIVADGQVLGVIEFFHSEPLDADLDTIELLKTMGAQIGQFILRTELIAKLRNSERQLADFFENAAIGLQWVGADGAVLRVNRSQLDLLGYASEDMLGKSASDFFVDGAALAEIMRRSNSGEAVRDFETTLLHRDGTVRTVLIDCDCYRENDRVVHTRCFARDITDRKKAEERLRRANIRNRAVLESSLDAIVTMDHEGRIIDFNSGAERIFGYTRVEVINQPLSELLIPERYREDHTTGLRRFLATGEGAMLNRLVELPAMRADGSEFAAELSISIVRLNEEESPRREPLSFTASVRDISARKRTERALKEREEELRLVTDGVPALISFVDANGRYTFANRQYEIWFGKPRRELYGKHMRDVLGDAAYNALRGHVESALAGHEAVYETWINYTTAGRRYIRGRYMPHFTDEGTVDGFFVLVTDETERKRAAAALEESEGRFWSMADSAPVMLWVSQVDRRFSYVNQRWLEFTGRSMEEELSSGRTRGIHPEDATRYVTTYALAFSLRRSFEMEYRFRRADGEYRWLWDVGIPRFSSAGEFAGFIGSCLDITDRKQAAIEMAAAKESAEESNRVRTQFLANVSHELRTPLNAIIGMTDLALEGELGEPLRDQLQTVRSSSDDLLRLVNEILDFSRMETGGLTLETTTFRLESTVDAVVKAFLPRAAQKGLELSAEFAADLPELVQGDPLRLRQIVTNLIGNAIKFTDQGRVEVRVELDAEPVNAPEADALVLRFSVRDTGIGIPREKFAAIFEPFTQADASTTRLYGGTGLGLAIAKGLVERMQGRVWVESQPRGGSTFFFTARLRRAAGGATWHGAALAEGRPLPPWTNGPLEILVVEDTPANQKLMTTLLQRRGHHVTVAADGAAALRQATGRHFDVVLMDIQMPIMDGFQTTAAIRAQEAAGARRALIVAMTAHASREDREQCLAAGMDAFVAKPIVGRMLIELVENLTANSHEEANRMHVDRSVPTGAESPRAIEPSELNLDAALARLDNDQTLFHEMADFFLADSPALLEQIRSGLAAPDRELLVRAAHSLKNLAATCGGEVAARAADHVEQLGGRENLGPVTAALVELETAVAKLSERLRGLDWES